MNDTVLSLYNDLLRKNRKQEIDELTDKLTEFLSTFVKNITTKKIERDRDELKGPRNKRENETQRQYETRIKNLDNAKLRRKSFNEQRSESNQMLEKHLSERLAKLQLDKNKKKDKRSKINVIENDDSDQSTE